jgi:hypothetical protein
VVAVVRDLMIIMPRAVVVVRCARRERPVRRVAMLPAPPATAVIRSLLKHGRRRSGRRRAEGGGR